MTDQDWYDWGYKQGLKRDPRWNHDNDVFNTGFKAGQVERTRRKLECLLTGEIYHDNPD